MGGESSLQFLSFVSWSLLVIFSIFARFSCLEENVPLPPHQGAVGLKGTGRGFL